MGTHYSHLTEADRISIQALLQAKLSCREISHGKLHATAEASGYQAVAAHLRCCARRAGAGAARRTLGTDMQTPLWSMVLSALRCHWSPEQIAGKLRDMNHAASPAERALPALPLTVSHETNYCAIHAMPRGTLRAELIDLLRKKSHKTRLPRARGSVRKSRLPNMTSICHLLAYWRRAFSP